MNRFLSFILKEMRHIIRDKRSLAILFLMPIIQLLIFGFAMTNELKNVDIAVLDNANDEYSAGLIQKLGSTSYFNIVQDLKSETEIYPILRKGEVREVVVIEQRFGRNLEKYGKGEVQLIIDAMDPNYGEMLNNYTSSIIADFTRELNPEMAQTAIITTQVKMQYNPQLHSSYMFIPGLMALILTLISAFMTSISITKEKELGTMEILLVSPLNPAQIILGKVIPYVLLSILNVIIILAASLFIFGIPIIGSLSLLMLISFIYICLALCLGILISTVTNSQQVAMMLSLVGLMLPTILLSGFIFPLESLPLFLQGFAKIIPASWFVHAVKGIMLKGSGFQELLPDFTVLCGMTIFFVVLSIKKFEIRLK